METPVVESVAAEDSITIRRVVERWLRFVACTERVDPSRAAEAIRAVYAVADMEAPPSVRWYPSPRAAWDAHVEWLPEIGRCSTQFWSFQLPLTNPSAFWLACGDRGDAIDIAIARTGNTLGALVYSQPLHDVRGSRIRRGALEQVYQQTSYGKHLDLGFAISRAGPQELFDALDDCLMAEEPTCQIGVEEYVTLGPVAWAVREAAALEVLADVLGCRVNRAHRDAIRAMVSQCGYSMVFRDLVVLCDRPVAVKSRDHVVTLQYVDDTTIVLDTTLR